MSTSVPVAFPAIPMPNASPESLQQATLAIKQNIEIGQGTRGTSFSANLHGPTSVAKAINAALLKVTP